MPKRPFNFIQFVWHKWRGQAGVPHGALRVLTLPISQQIGDTGPNPGELFGTKLTRVPGGYVTITIYFIL